MRERPFPFDPVIEAYKNHIDRTLIRESLKLTIDQRFAEELKRAGREMRERGTHGRPPGEKSGR
jgi:hypothetical protein